MVTLICGDMEIAVDPLGAELSSVKLHGREWLWNGDPAVWSGRAPILFPICGGLKDGQYTYKGNTYRLPKHGFARRSLFTLEEQTDSSLSFLLTDSEDTRAVYPFAFALRVTYTVTGDRLTVAYSVTNRGEETLYYSIGAHEGYDCRPEGIEAYEVVFEKPETAGAYVLNGELLEHRTVPVLQNTDTLPLKKAFFAVDALVFKDLASRSVTLRHRATGRSLRLEFPDMAYFLLWTKPSGEYICLEPWCGIQPAVDCDYELTAKEGIIALAPGETRVQRHAVTFDV